jgi:hypothetical protein
MLNHSNFEYPNNATHAEEERKDGLSHYPSPGNQTMVNLGPWLSNFVIPNIG